MALPPIRPTKPRINPDARLKCVALLNELVDSLVAKFGSNEVARIYDPLARTGRRQKPLLYALLPEVVRASEMERSISSRFGTILQKIARDISRGAGHTAESEVTVVGEVASAVITHIGELVRPGRAKETPPSPPNLTEEIQTLRTLNQGPKARYDVTIDLFVESGGVEYYFDLKTPSPNSEQPRGMKSRLMRVRALRLPVDVHAYAVFYYNPSGTEGAFSTGRAYLDYPQGEVLVGAQFWDLLAGEGTYGEVIEIFRSVGESRREDLTKLVVSD